MKRSFIKANISFCDNVWKLASQNVNDVDDIVNNVIGCAGWHR